MFREMLSNYDVDGIELNFRRHPSIISNPLKNHPVLTELVGDVRGVLDQAANKKGRGRMILGVRVCPMLEGPYLPAEFPGSHYHQNENPSCRDAGIDISAWVRSGDVDYIAPMLFNTFLPGLPKTREFVKLAKGTDVGVYPTLFSTPMWLYPAHGNHVPPGGEHESPMAEDDNERLVRYKNELCECVLEIYDNGADGISTFNWYCMHQPGIVPEPDILSPWLGVGGKKVLEHFASVIGSRKTIQAYNQSDRALPDV
jgi:hypothetical protein